MSKRLAVTALDEHEGSQQPSGDTTPLPASGLSKADFGEAKLVRRNEFVPSVRMKPHISTMLADAYCVLGGELEILRRRAEVGEALTDKEAKKLAIYVDSLRKLAQEERDQETRIAHTMDALPADERAAKVLEAMKTLGLGKGSDEM